MRKRADAHQLELNGTYVRTAFSPTEELTQLEKELDMPQFLVFVSITTVYHKISQITKRRPCSRQRVVILCCAAVISKHSSRYGKCGLLKPFPSCMPNTQLHTPFSKRGVCLALCLFHGDLLQELLSQPLRIVDLASLRAVLEERDVLMLLFEMAQ